LTADVFFHRLREAQAKTEDFDEVVAEFGRGCPCKEPPLKSKGKAHLGSQAHGKAFNTPGGVYFGMSVRAAFEAQGAPQRPGAIIEDPPLVVNVAGSQRIGNDDADENEDAGDHDDDWQQMDEMEPPAEGEDGEVVSREIHFTNCDDDDVGDIQVHGDE
jgi:hypothetical protein